MPQTGGRAQSCFLVGRMQILIGPRGKVRRRGRQDSHPEGVLAVSRSPSFWYGGGESGEGLQSGEFDFRRHLLGQEVRERPIGKEGIKEQKYVES